MSELWQRQWIRYHVVFAPFGILAVTALLTYLTAPEPWSIRQGLNQAAAQVDLAVPIYAALAALAERGIAMIFWALEQRKKWREERLEALAARDAAVREQVRDEVRTEVRDEVRTEVRDEVRTEVRDEVKTEVRDEVKTEVRDEVKTEVRDEVRTEVRDEIARDMAARLEQWARERGISPDDLPRLP